VERRFQGEKGKNEGGGGGDDCLYEESLLRGGARGGAWGGLKGGEAGFGKGGRGKYMIPTGDGTIGEG